MLTTLLIIIFCITKEFFPPVTLQYNSDYALLVNQDETEQAKKSAGLGVRKGS